MNALNKIVIVGLFALSLVPSQGCGGGGGSGGGENIPLKRASWQQELKYADGSDIPASDLQGFLIYVKTDDTFMDNDAVSDDPAASSVLTGVDNSTGTPVWNCEYDLRRAYSRNSLNLTDNYYVAIRSVSVFGGVSSFSSPSRSFSFSE